MKQGVTKPYGESSVDAAAYCFRKGLTTREEDMKPDLALVHKMLDARLRVQDLIEMIAHLRHKEPLGKSLDAKLQLLFTP